MGKLRTEVVYSTTLRENGKTYFVKMSKKGIDLKEIKPEKKTIIKVKKNTHDGQQKLF